MSLHALFRWTVRPFFVFALAAVLTACTTAPIASQQALTGNEGAVVVKLITNGAAEFEPAEARVPGPRPPARPGRKAAARDTATPVRTSRGRLQTPYFTEWCCLNWSCAE